MVTHGASCTRLSLLSAACQLAPDLETLQPLLPFSSAPLRTHTCRRAHKHAAGFGGDSELWLLAERSPIFSLRCATLGAQAALKLRYRCGVRMRPNRELGKWPKGLVGFRGERDGGGGVCRGGRYQPYSQFSQFLVLFLSPDTEKYFLPLRWVME